MCVCSPNGIPRETEGAHPNDTLPSNEGFTSPHQGLMVVNDNPLIIELHY